ncbi:unnamed protein product [Sphagnum tenellum]
MRVAEREGDDRSIYSLCLVLTLQVFMDSLTTPEVYCTLIGSLWAKNNSLGVSQCASSSILALSVSRFYGARICVFFAATN